MDWPDPFPGASLETVGNGSPRKMIVQRQNPAYRSAHIYEKRPCTKKEIVSITDCMERRIPDECCRMNIYNHKIGNKKLFTAIVLAAILGMFLVRAILLKSGTIDNMYTLEPDALHDALSKYEVTIRSEQSGTIVTGGGTILDGRKQSTKDEQFTLTIAAAAHVVGDAQTVTVVMPDGTQTEGTVVSVSESTDDVAFVQCLWDEELDGYYSRDLLERLQVGDAVYALKSDGSGKVLVSGTAAAVGSAVDGIGDDLILAEIGSENGMSGSGLYGKSGNYLGMIVQGTEEGTAACIPADIIEKAMSE